MLFGRDPQAPGADDDDDDAAGDALPGLHNDSRGPDAAPPPPDEHPAEEVERQGLRARKAQLRAQEGAYEQQRRSTRAVHVAQRQGLQNVREMGETMALFDSGHKQLAMAMNDVIGTLRDATQRIRDDFGRDPQAPAPQTSGKDVLIEGFRAVAQLGVAFFQNGGGQKLLGALSSLAPGLGGALGAEAPAGPADPAAPAAAPQAGPGAAPPPPGAAPPGGWDQLPELAVLYDKIPEEVRRHISLDDLRALTNLVAGLRARGTPVTPEMLAQMLGVSL